MRGVSFYGEILSSRLLLGTARYPSPAILEDTIRKSGVDIVTLSLRREKISMRDARNHNGQNRNGQMFLELIRKTGVRILPNTAGCHSVREAVTTAHMARELLGTSWIKLEVIGSDQSLHPDVFGLVEAARLLVDDGFQVFPYTTADLGVAERLLQAGCQVLMPWAAPIGSSQGVRNSDDLHMMRESFPDVPLVVDAGIGRPSHAARVMELGFDAVLLNTAVARSGNPAQMALAFTQAIEAGRMAFLAGMTEPQAEAVASSPLIGRATL